MLEQHGHGPSVGCVMWLSGHNRTGKCSAGRRPDSQATEGAAGQGGDYVVVV